MHVLKFSRFCVDFASKVIFLDREFWRIFGGAGHLLSPGMEFAAKPWI